MAADWRWGLEHGGDGCEQSLPALGGATRLHSFIHGAPHPLHLLYAILSEPALEEFVSAPTTRRQWRDFPGVKQVLVGELGGLWVDGTGGDSRTSERLVWVLTRRLRNNAQTPLTRFAAMVYGLMDEATVESDGFELHRFQESFRNIQGYAGGPEVATSFAALSGCLACTSLSSLRRAQQSIDQVEQDPEPIRPAVLAALSRLGDVAAEVATFQASTSRVNKLAALGRATDSLDDLDEFVTQEVVPPEQFLLRRIIRQWRRLISEAGGELGRAQVAGPVANPYVLNNPVKPPLFQGREDVLRRLEELWSGEGQKPSVVLYGHRRMGKSSILQNLGEGARFGKNTVIVDFNMQHVRARRQHGRTAAQPGAGAV